MVIVYNIQNIPVNLHLFTKNINKTTKNILYKYQLI